MTSEKRTRLVAGVAQDLITRYKYDAKGNLIETTAPDGVTTKTTYNAIDKVATETDPESRITRYEYTTRGEPSKVIYPDGSFTETTYDPDGNTTSQKDRLGRETKMVYDAVSRLLETIEPDTTPANAADNPRTRTIYDAAGQVTAQIDAKGNRTEFKYDLAGRQIEVKDALGNVMTTQYDVAGQRVSSTDALGRKMQYVYDLAGRMVETIYPDPIAEDADLANNPRTKVTLDPGGRKIGETDEMGRITRYQYDKLSRLITVVLPNPTSGANPEPIDGVFPATAGTLITKYEYDEQGNKTAQIDALGRTTRWNYDQSGRNLTRTLPMGQVETQHYSATGERTKHTSFNGIDTQFSYDNLGRMDKITFPNNRVRQFTYDTAGRTTQINDGGQIYQFYYDERDRLITATDPYSRSLNYQYDINGNRTQAKTDKQQIDFTFDELNRLKELTAQVNNQPGQITKYAYTEVGSRASQTNPNGTQVSYQYDRRNRLKSLIHHASQAANAAVLLSLSYTVDASGLRTQINETRPGATISAPITRNTSYIYDGVKRLTSEIISGTNSQNRNSAWTYNAVGNRLTERTSGNTNKYVDYTYDNNDRLTREVINGGNQFNKEYSYDQNGNTVQMKQGTAITSYRWDEENRMIGATIGNKTMSYAYDANGIRRSQEVTEGSNRTRTEYLIDPNQSYAQVIEEWNASGATTGAMPDETLAVSFVYGDDLISQTIAALGAVPVQTNVYHYDGLGTTRALSNMSAAITDRYAYTAFGETDTAGTSGNNSGTTPNSYLYTGEQKDSNLGLYYLRARYMNPGTGGFISQDSYMGSSQDPTSLHKYLYASANPVMGIDPSGNFTLGQVMAVSSVIGALSGLATGAIADGWRGALYGAAYGAVISPIVTAGVFLGGPLLGAAIGVSEGTGIAIAGAGATLVYSAAGIRQVTTAQTTREKVAASVGLAITAAGAFLGVRAYYNVRAGRGTFTNRNPNANPEEIAVGRWMANALRLDVIAKAPEGARGAGTSDYHIAFRGQSVELKNMTGTTSERSMANRIGLAQSENVVVIVNRGQVNEAAMASRVFNGGSSKNNIQFIYEDGNGYVAGSTHNRGK